MSWYRDSDGKIITDEEFQSDCYECSAFCSEGTITIPCNGERTDCPHFKEVDTSDYDKEIRNKAIDEALEKSAKAICVGCAYLNGHKCTYNGANCGVSKPMLEAVTKALEQMKEVGEWAKN